MVQENKVWKHYPTTKVLSYKQYLMIFLFMTSTKKMKMRIADIYINPFLSTLGD